MNAPVEYRCPHCDNKIFNRRIKSCGFCGESLPAELLLTKEQIQEFDTQLAEEKKNADQWKQNMDNIASSMDGSIGL